MPSVGFRPQVNSARILEAQMWLILCKILLKKEVLLILKNSSKTTILKTSIPPVLKAFPPFLGEPLHLQGQLKPYSVPLHLEGSGHSILPVPMAYRALP